MNAQQAIREMALLLADLSRRDSTSHGDRISDGLRAAHHPLSYTDEQVLLLLELPAHVRMAAVQATFQRHGYKNPQSARNSLYGRATRLGVTIPDERRRENRKETR